MPAKRARAAYEPPRFDLADAMAIKRLALGEADAESQKRALEWIVYGVLGLRDEPYDPDSARNTDYALGRQGAAREIVLYTTLPPDELKALADRRNPQRRKDTHAS